jgi:hypothetical protein
MKNRIILGMVLLTATSFARAQEFKLPKNSGRLEIHLGQATIEGHDGKEIIFSSRSGRNDRDVRAEGLRAVNGNGLTDNTGLGINVSDKGNVVEVYQLSKTKTPDIRILVPKGMIVSFEYASQHGGEIKFINLTNEIEISAQYNSISLDNVTGPITAKTIYGHIEATFGTSIKDPVSIVSVYGYVDVTLPQATKANLKLSTAYGAILVAPEFDIKVESSGGMVHYSDKVNGTINGGGVNIDLNCNYGKVYLRKS